jgi:hypothetical protein
MHALKHPLGSHNCIHMGRHSSSLVMAWWLLQWNDVNGHCMSQIWGATCAVTSNTSSLPYAYTSTAWAWRLRSVFLFSATQNIFYQNEFVVQISRRFAELSSLMGKWSSNVSEGGSPLWPKLWLGNNDGSFPSEAPLQHQNTTCVYLCSRCINHEMQLVGFCCGYFDLFIRFVPWTLYFDGKCLQASVAWDIPSIDVLLVVARSHCE